MTRVPPWRLAEAPFFFLTQWEEANKEAGGMSQGLGEMVG